MPPCAGRATVVSDPSLTEYDFGPSHPMSPVRVDLTVRLARDLGVLERLGVVPAPVAGEDLIATVHDRGMIEAVQRAGADPLRFEPAYGLGSDDNPVFPDMHRAAAHVVGATAEAFRQVWSGESRHSASICGGLHHAMPDRASGFCIYNDVAVGIRWLLDQGVEKVAYVDVDVHHGDGVEQIFYDDPRVLTISLHQDSCFPPGSGPLEENGAGAGEGFNLNLPLPPGSGTGAYEHAFREVVIPALDAFRPQLIVVASGLDASAMDPLGRMMMTPRGYGDLTRLLLDAADRHCEGRLVVEHEGGYNEELVPFCALAIVEALSGIETDCKDTILQLYPEGMGYQDLQPHQADVIARAAELVSRVAPDASSLTS
jgi:acetoin utilization protein AcuC